MTEKTDLFAELKTRGTEILFWGGMLLLLILLLRVLLPFSLSRFFALDEFEYAHGAWSISQGLVPFRDYFESHLPLLPQLLSLISASHGDSAGQLITMRLFMLGLFVVSLFLGARLNRGWGRAAMLLGSLAMIGMFPYANYSLEIRNDSIAFFFFLLTLALLSYRHRHVLAFHVLSGTALALAVWGSQKTLVYGAVFFAAWLVDVFKPSEEKRERVLEKPLIFTGAFVLVLLCFVLHAAFNGSLSALYTMCFRYFAEQRGIFLGFSWVYPMLDELRSSWWLMLLAAYGVVHSVAHLRGSESTDSKTFDPAIEKLLLLSLFSTFISYVIQPAPYAYSTIPFFGVSSIYAGRGAARLFERLWGSAHLRVFAVGLALFGGLMFFYSVEQYPIRVQSKPNEPQLETINSLLQLTAPNDMVYDNSGTAITRPHPYFHYYTDHHIRTHFAARLNREVPEAIVQKETVAVVFDDRYPDLPMLLRRFIETNFQKYSGEIRLWGRKYEVTESKDLQFLAITEGWYFIEPAAALKKLHIEIDGKPVQSAHFPLSKGRHTVKFDNPSGAKTAFHILWLPRNGKQWSPHPDAEPYMPGIL